MKAKFALSLFAGSDAATGSTVKYLIGVLLLVLSGCATVGPQPHSGWDERRAMLQALPEWSLRGRIAVRYAKGGEQGNILWSQQQDASHINLSGPFGSGAMDIVWSPQRIELQDGKKSLSYTGPDAAQRFMAEQLGWIFPPSSGRYWVMGVPDPGSVYAETFDAAGELATLEQSGWTVRYKGYANQSGTLLPRKVEITRADVRIIIAIHQWDAADFVPVVVR